MRGTRAAVAVVALAAVAACGGGTDSVAAKPGEVLTAPGVSRA